MVEQVTHCTIPEVLLGKWYPLELGQDVTHVAASTLRPQRLCAHIQALGASGIHPLLLFLSH